MLQNVHYSQLWGGKCSKSEVPFQHISLRVAVTVTEAYWFTSVKITASGVRARNYLLQRNHLAFHSPSNSPAVESTLLKRFLCGYPKSNFLNGYSLRFCGILHPMVSIDHTHILRTKVQALPENGAVEKVPTTHSQSGFFSRFFLVPKKDGSLRPILDLHVLNRSLMTLLFKILTAKRIIAQIHPGDWFISVDRKDVYFHAPTQTTLEIRVRGERHTNTWSYPLGSLSPGVHLPNVWMLHLPLWDRCASAFWIVSTTGWF